MQMGGRSCFITNGAFCHCLVCRGVDSVGSVWNALCSVHPDPGNALHYIALLPTALHCTAMHCTALHCTALHYTALHCTALHCTALHCTALHCTALHCPALYCKYSIAGQRHQYCNELSTVNVAVAVA